MSFKNQELIFSLFLARRANRSIQFFTRSGQMFYGDIKHCGSDYVTIDIDKKGELWYFRIENIEGFRFIEEQKEDVQP